MRVSTEDVERFKKIIDKEPGTETEEEMEFAYSMREADFLKDVAEGEHPWDDDLCRGALSSLLSTGLMQEYGLPEGIAIPMALQAMMTVVGIRKEDNGSYSIQYEDGAWKATGL